MPPRSRAGPGAMPPAPSRRARPRPCGACTLTPIPGCALPTTALPCLQADAKCEAYTWHDQHQGGWALDCIGRRDGQYTAVAEDGHFSGRSPKAVPASGPSPSPPGPPAGPPNIYSTAVGDKLTNGMLGLQLNGERATIARYPNQPGGVEVSCGYGCMVNGGSATWTPPDFNKYGAVDCKCPPRPLPSAGGWPERCLPARQRGGSGSQGQGLCVVRQGGWRRRQGEVLYRQAAKGAAAPVLFSCSRVALSFPLLNQTTRT